MDDVERHKRLVKSFWKKVEKGKRSECWKWIGWVQKNGYGKYCYGHNKYYLPHRFAYMQTKGEIPKGLLVCHKCDNRLCCNPNHFFIGTHKDNSQDAVKKGRWNSPKTYTDTQVLEVRKRYVKSRGVGKLAAELKMNPKYVWAIGNGKTRTNIKIK